LSVNNALGQVKKPHSTIGLIKRGGEKERGREREEREREG